MSRYYDLLKEANRLPDPERILQPSKQHASEEPALGLPDPLGVLPARDEAAQANPVPPKISVPHAATLDEPLEEAFADILQKASPTRPETPVATKATAIVDRKVPVIAHARDTAGLEHYRRLRTKLVQQNGIQAFRSLLIASAAPQEGKTVTALNLASSYSMLSSFKVLVIDGDLRRGGLGKCLGLEGRPGFQNLIEGSARDEEAIFDCSDLGVHVMPRGDSRISPAELLQSEKLPKLLNRWEEQFDLVILDSCPLNLLTDTQVLAVHCDAILLVARAFTTKQKALEKAIHDLKPHRILGTILNGHTDQAAYGGYRGYY